MAKQSYTQEETTQFIIRAVVRAAVRELGILGLNHATIEVDVDEVRRSYRVRIEDIPYRLGPERAP